jgi:hypothetical protein
MDGVGREPQYGLFADHFLDHARDGSLRHRDAGKWSPVMS